MSESTMPEITFALTLCHRQSVHSSRAESNAPCAPLWWSRRKVSTATTGGGRGPTAPDTSRRHRLNASVTLEISVDTGLLILLILTARRTMVNDRRRRGDPTASGSASARIATVSFVTYRRGSSVVSVVAGPVQRNQARTRSWGDRITTDPA